MSDEFLMFKFKVGFLCRQQQSKAERLPPASPASPAGANALVFILLIRHTAGHFLLCPQIEMCSRKDRCVRARAHAPSRSWFPAGSWPADPHHWQQRSTLTGPDHPVGARACFSDTQSFVLLRALCRHDWKICPYAHPGEVARRRHPRGYTAVLCPAKTAVRHTSCAVLSQQTWCQCFTHAVE
jgi:hypothetical protein